MTGENVEPEITVTSPDAEGQGSKSSSLIVVSNRLPFVLKKNEKGEMLRQARLVNVKFWSKKVHNVIKMILIGAKKLIIIADNFWVNFVLNSSIIFSSHSITPIIKISLWVPNTLMKMCTIQSLNDNHVKLFREFFHVLSSEVKIINCTQTFNAL